MEYHTPKAKIIRISSIESKNAYLMQSTATYVVGRSLSVALGRPSCRVRILILLRKVMHQCHAPCHDDFHKNLEILVY